MTNSWSVGISGSGFLKGRSEQTEVAELAMNKSSPASIRQSSTLLRRYVCRFVKKVAQITIINFSIRLNENNKSTVVRSNTNKKA